MPYPCLAGGVGRGKRCGPICPSSPSLVEAPEEPSIQVNPLGISVNSEEPEEVSHARVARRGLVGPERQRDSRPVPLRLLPVWGEMGTPFLKSSGTRMGGP